jgi:hypothetical protein
MHNRGRITTNVVHKMDPFVCPITATVTTGPADMYATTHLAKATITGHRGIITPHSARLPEGLAMRRVARTRRNAADLQGRGSHTATISRMADTPVNQLHSTYHDDDFMAVANELVIQQLTSSRLDCPELEQLRASIESRLVLNLSSPKLTADQLSFLQLGIGFRPNFTEIPRTGTSSEVNAVDCAVQKLAQTMHVSMNRLQYDHERCTSRANRKKEENPKQAL